MVIRVDESKDLYIAIYDSLLEVVSSDEFDVGVILLGEYGDKYNLDKLQLSLHNVICCSKMLDNPQDFIRSINIPGVTMLYFVEGVSYNSEGKYTLYPGRSKLFGDYADSLDKIIFIKTENILEYCKTTYLNTAITKLHRISAKRSDFKNDVAFNILVDSRAANTLIRFFERDGRYDLLAELI